ncbi:MAG: sulfurase [Alphaproteobacteria bacterium]|nr:sulfurase [Alphaproteobacteria bacterium]
MAQLQEISCIGRVVCCYLSHDRKPSLEKIAKDRLEITLDGVVGDCHSGRTRVSDSRTLKQYLRGIDIVNSRQFSIASIEELAEVATRMEIPKVKAEWIGANLLVKDIPHFTLLPPSSRLMFSSGGTVIIDLENHPCKYPAEVIERHHPGKGLAFPKVAMKKRGVVAYAEKGGAIAIGDTIRVFIPTQEAWPHRERYLRGE